MKVSAFYAVLGVGVLVVAGIIWWGVSHSHKKGSVEQPAPITQVATSTLSGLSIYTNGTYGFSMMYPSAFSKQTDFASPQNGIVALGSPSEQVLVSVASDTASVVSCASLHSGETEHQPIVMQGVTWHVFSRTNVGIDTSYRTVHDNACFTIHEVAPTAPDNTLFGIVHSFTFAR